jgi:hypothetical protein
VIGFPLRPPVIAVPPLAGVVTVGRIAPPGDVVVDCTTDVDLTGGSAVMRLGAVVTTPVPFARSGSVWEAVIPRAALTAGVWDVLIRAGGNDWPVAQQTVI